MIDLNEVYSLTEFQRNAKEHIERLNKTRTPQVLTVNGKASVVLVDATEYQKMLDAIERAEAIEGIKRGLKEADAGKLRPFGEFLQELKQKYERPDKS